MSLRAKFEIVPLSEVPHEGETESSMRRPIVLVVDDERLVADSLTAILSQSGYVAFTAYDGESAFEFVQMIHPDVLITDVAMPGMGGVALAMLVAPLVPDCSILLFSGHATGADLEIAQRAGYSFPLLRKPVHPLDLLKCLSKQSRRERKRAVAEREMNWAGDVSPVN